VADFNRLCGSAVTDNLSTDVERLSVLLGSPRAFETAQGLVIDGSGCGEPLIMAYFGDSGHKGAIKLRDVRAILEIMKASGQHQQITKEELAADAARPDGDIHARRKAVER
jgi:hypothetical protein